MRSALCTRARTPAAGASGFRASGGGVYGGNAVAAQIAYPQGYVCMNIRISNILDDAVRRKVESLGHLRHSEPAIVGGPKRRLDALHLATILQVGWTRRLGIGTRHP